MCCMEFHTALATRVSNVTTCRDKQQGYLYGNIPEVPLYLCYHVHEHHHIVLCGLASDTGVGSSSLSLRPSLFLFHTHTALHTQPYAFMRINFITALATVQSFPSLSLSLCLSLSHTHTHLLLLLLLSHLLLSNTVCLFKSLDQQSWVSTHISNTVGQCSPP